MKHAYLIIVHNELELLKNLVSLLDDKRNDIYIHYDSKLKDIPSLHTEYSNLYIIDKRINVHWADFSLVEVEFELMQEAFIKGKYDYYHFLSGVDMPLKPQDYIHDFFNRNVGKEFIDYCLADVSGEMDRKMRLWHLFPSDFKNSIKISFVTRFLRAVFVRVQIMLGFKRNRNIEFKKGSQWVSITADFVKFLLENKDEIRKTYTHTFCPDEVVMQTACWNSPFRNNLYDLSADYKGHMRKIDWGRGRPYVWRDEDYDELMSSDRLFARKFSSEYMGVVNRITETLKLKNNKNV